jgi:hypothetical protein
MTSLHFNRGGRLLTQQQAALSNNGLLAVAYNVYVALHSHRSRREEASTKLASRVSFVLPFYEVLH